MGKSVKEGIMPRETVRSADYNFVPLAEGTDGSTPWDPSTRLGVVEVGWAKAPTGHVELATCDEAALHGPDGLYLQIAKALIEGWDVERVVRDFFESGGFWVGLDRAGCNDLIKRVRKARDDAFGKDE